MNSSWFRAFIHVLGNSTESRVPCRFRARPSSSYADHTRLSRMRKGFARVVGWRSSRNAGRSARLTDSDHDRGKVDSITSGPGRKFIHTNAMGFPETVRFTVWGDGPSRSGSTVAPDHRPGLSARSNRAGLTDRSFKNSGKHSSDLAADNVRVGGILHDILR